MFTWHNGEVREGLPTTQVWGILFSSDGRVLLKGEIYNGKKVYSFPGGKPEPQDANRVETLRREVLEEVNITIKVPVLVGYQTCIDEGREIAQVRMTAIIEKVGKPKPDVDSKILYERVLVHPQKAIKMLNYSKSGKQQVEAAMKVAKVKLGIEEFLDKDEYI